MASDDPLDSPLRDAIAQLRDSQPASDLWPGIAHQLVPRRPRGTVLLRWPTALAAGLAIAVATGGGTALVLHHQMIGVTATTASAPLTAPTDSTMTIAASFAPGDAALAHAISDLERVVRTQLTALDPKARTSVTTSLAALDRAIAQATARQTASPDDPRAARLLTSTLRKKLQVLRTVSELATRS